MPLHANRRAQITADLADLADRSRRLHEHAAALCNAVSWASVRAGSTRAYCRKQVHVRRQVRVGG
jgi:hypothetical protein